MLCGFAGQDSTAAVAKVREWQSRQRDFLAATGLKRKSAREQVALTGVPVSGIMNRTLADGGLDVRTVGYIDIEKYRCIAENIITDEVIITQERVQHIKDRHPGHFEVIEPYLKEALENPKYILEDAPNTGLILKVISGEGLNIKVVLRVHTSNDPDEFKNSILSAWYIRDKEYRRLIRNKKILYKEE